MGLDNGLIIKGKTIKGKKFLEENFPHLLENEDFRYEFGYWRKCYNIREAILNTFKSKDYDGNGGYIYLTIADLWDFRATLKYFLIEENWVEGNSFTNGSIWTWEEVLPRLGTTIYNITDFINEIEYTEGDLTDNDFEIYFYDSY